MEQNTDTHKKALNLIELMKNGSLSIEQLKELVPMTTDFIKEFCGAVRTELNNRANNNLEALKLLGKALDMLEGIKIEECSDEVKIAVINQIGEIQKHIYDLGRSYDDNSTKTIWSMIALIGAVLVLIMGLGSNNQKTFPRIS